MNSAKVTEPMKRPSIGTSSTAAEPRPSAQSNRLINATMSTIDTDLETSTPRRLTGLPSKNPNVPSRSSPAIADAPQLRARPATVKAPIRLYIDPNAIPPVPSPSGLMPTNSRTPAGRS